jgi:hypothetical protein
MEHIFLALSFDDMIALACADKLLNNISEDDRFWRQHLKNKLEESHSISTPQLCNIGYGKFKGISLFANNGKLVPIDIFKTCGTLIKTIQICIKFEDPVKKICHILNGNGVKHFRLKFLTWICNDFDYYYTDEWVSSGYDDIKIMREGSADLIYKGPGDKKLKDLTDPNGNKLIYTLTRILCYPSMYEYGNGSYFPPGNSGF